VDLDGVKCYSLSLEDLILNKAATQRPKDMLDLVQLKNLLEAKNSSLNLNKEININSQKEALSESAAEYKAACGLSQEEIRDKIYNTKDVDVGLSHK
jgi:predicted nucleotidyltransferase